MERDGMFKVRVMDGLPQEREILSAALTQIEAIVEGDVLSELGMNVLHRRLRDRLAGKRPLLLRCNGAEDRSELVHLRDPEAGVVDISRAAFTLGSGRIAAALFWMLVRMCGGSTLDAEALQRHAFPGVGPPPSPEVLVQMKRFLEVDGYRVGRWVLWDPLTGEVFTRQSGGVTPGRRLRSLLCPPGVRRVPDRAPERVCGEVHQEAPADRNVVVEEEPVAIGPEAQEPEDLAGEAAEQEPATAAGTAKDPGQIAMPDELQSAGLETPVSAPTLLAGIPVPAGAWDRVQEFLNLAPRSSDELREVLDDITQFLMDQLRESDTSRSERNLSTPERGNNR